MTQVKGVKFCPDSIKKATCIVCWGSYTIIVNVRYFNLAMVFRWWGSMYTHRRQVMHIHVSEFRNNSPNCAGLSQGFSVILTYWGQNRMAASLKDDTLKRSFFSENVYIIIQVLLRIVTLAIIDNMTSLVQVTALRLIKNRKAVNVCWPGCATPYASQSHDELIQIWRREMKFRDKWIEITSFSFSILQLNMSFDKWPLWSSFKVIFMHQTQIFLRMITLVSIKRRFGHLDKHCMLFTNR